MLHSFQSSLIAWFRKEARDLPWRHTSDPYRIWISEMMLHQTQVTTVIPYYNRFLKQFPTLQSLSLAQEDGVLKLWEGLGYYRRAKHILGAAQILMEKFSGNFPRTREKLLTLPGIGEYSAGALLAIVFHQREAAVDGNVIRVISRIFAIKKPVDDSKILKKIWEIAAICVPKKASDIRDYTEGMMELGARICLPKNPCCSQCPIQRHCEAFKIQLVHKIPWKQKKIAREKNYEMIYVAEKNNKMAVVPRGSDPKYPLFHRLPFRAIASPPLTFHQKMKYSVTHRDFTVFITQQNPLQKVIWLSKEKLPTLLFPAIDRRILKHFDLISLLA